MNFDYENKARESKSDLGRRVLKIGRRYPNLPQGEYKATITDIQEGSFIGKRPIFVFTFRIAEGSHTGAEINGFVNGGYETFTDHTKLFKWYQACTGWDLPAGDEIRIDDFFNRLVKVHVESKRSKKTRNEFSNVTDVIGLVCEI